MLRTERQNRCCLRKKPLWGQTRRKGRRWRLWRVKDTLGFKAQSDTHLVRITYLNRNSRKLVWNLGLGRWAQRDESLPGGHMCGWQQNAPQGPVANTPGAGCRSLQGWVGPRRTLCLPIGSLWLSRVWLSGSCANKWAALCCLQALCLLGDG